MTKVKSGRMYRYQPRAKKQMTLARHGHSMLRREYVESGRLALSWPCLLECPSRHLKQHFHLLGNDVSLPDSTSRTVYLHFPMKYSPMPMRRNMSLSLPRFRECHLQPQARLVHHVVNWNIDCLHKFLPARLATD